MAPKAKEPKILIVADDKIYGPFPDVSTADTWRRSHSVGEHWGIYSLWDREMGTCELAQECGIKLESCCR